MPVRSWRSRGRRRPPSRTVRPHLEFLEARCLLSSGPSQPILEHEPNNTLDQAQALGTLPGRVEVLGSIGGTEANSDIDWYSFTLTRPSAVSLSAAPKTGQAGPVLSLYNSDPNDFADPFDVFGHRLLAQAQGASGTPAVLADSLAAGTYYVAVSGAGNRWFDPFLAGSGYPARLCNYDMQLSATALALGPADGPVVLAATPAAGDALGSSPLVLRLDLSSALDPNTVLPGQTVALIYNPTGNFGDGNDQDVFLVGANFSTAADELQLTPMDALAPGYYQLFLAGDASTGNPVLADPNGTPLGADAAHPQGQDFQMTFQVTGVEGGAAADDTPATAQALGDITKAGLVQAAGAIGDDPAYDPNNPDPNLQFAGNDVDLYHFTISGAGRYALTAEVFAGRIGSPLNPALTLFRNDPVNGLQLVGVNDDSLNGSVGTDGSVPLALDPVLYAGLTAGDYYLAVSSSGNAPNPALGIMPGTNGVFDPNVSHSGSAGYSTGAYELNLMATAETARPRVLNVSLTPGAKLSAPPTTFTVQFSEPVNLPQLIYQTFQQSSSMQLDAVYIRGSDGVQYHPRMISYDSATNRATFLMLDAVPNGPAELHFSGAGSLGLQDLAGGALVPSPGQSTDYVVSFTVNGPARGTNGNPLLWTDREPNNSFSSAQNLGVLFPDELQQGVVIQRPLGASATDRADYYKFQVLQQRDYLLTLNGSNLPANTLPTLTDASGKTITGIPQGKGGAVRFNLAPGTYVVSVGGWTPVQAALVQYKLTVLLTAAPDNPPPLTVGPAPAIGIQIASDTPPNPTPMPTPTPTPTPPPSTPPGGGTTPAPDTTGDTASNSAAAGDATPPATDDQPPAPTATALSTSELVLLTLPGLSGLSTLPGGGTVGSSSAFENVLLTRVADSTGVRADLVADGGGDPDLAQTPDRPAAADDAPPRDPGPVAKAGPDAPPAVEASAPMGAPSASPLDVVFGMNLFSGRFFALHDASGPANGGFTGLPDPAAPGAGGQPAAPPALWVDVLAVASAFAAAGLTGWSVVGLRSRRKKDNQDLNLLAE